MPRSASIPLRLYRRAPPPPEDRLYHRDYAPPPATTSTSSPDHLTLESADGVSFYVSNSLVARSSFFADLYSLPGVKQVVPLQGISASILAFALACVSDARRVRRHSAPILGPRRKSRSPPGSSSSPGPNGGALSRGFAPTSSSGHQPPLLPPDAWSWTFLTQVLTLAFAYELPHALERLAADSGDFYNPVLGYTLWSLVAAAKGEPESKRRKSTTGPGTGTAFPSSSSPPPPPSSDTIMSWAHALLRHDGTIPAWCAHALYTHHPDGLDALQDLFARRTEITAQLAAAEERIGAGESMRQKEASWDDGLSKRNSWDVFVRRASVATFLLRVDRVDLNTTPTAPADIALVPPQRRKSLRRSGSPKGKAAKADKCTPTCRPTFKRKLTAATALVTRQFSAEKFGTVEYFVEYTYEGIPCAACRETAKDGLVWIWCMKAPWRGGVGV